MIKNLQKLFDNDINGKVYRDELHDLLISFYVDMIREEGSKDYILKRYLKKIEKEELDYIPPWEC